MLPSRLIAASILTFVLGLLLRIPAAHVLYRVGLDRAGIHLAGVHGTLFQGGADHISIRGLELGALDWDMRGLPLLLARASAWVDFGSDTIRGSGRLILTPSTYQLEDLWFQIELSDVDLATLGLPLAVPLSGSLSFEGIDASGDRAHPSAIDGQAVLRDLHAGGPLDLALGSYQAVFATGDGRPEATVTELAGPIAFEGRLVLLEDGSWTLTGSALAKAGAPAALTQGLEFLGPADARGAHTLSFQGHLPGEI